jgi:S-DNA-T family DNA segregation ATPase FtsK/SpoIIIE
VRGSSTSGGGESPFDLILDALQGQGTPAQRIWLPPLNEPYTLDQLLPPLQRTPDRGLNIAEAHLYADFHALAGIIDRPRQQRFDALSISPTTGHLAIVGGPRTGKSTLAATVIGSVALAHTPAETQFYCLDFGGSALSALAELPHVGSVASRRQPELVHRTIAELSALIAPRHDQLTRAGVTTAASWQQQVRTHDLADDAYGDVFLVIDHWGALRDIDEGLEEVVVELAAAGFGAGLHLVVTAGSWSEIRPEIRELFQHRLELRLPDARESQIDPKAAALVPEGRPGRGITPDGSQFLSVLPRIDGTTSADDLAQGIRSMVHAVKEAWNGPPAPPVRMLPDLLPFDALPRSERGIPVGIEEEALSPVVLDFARDPHFVVFGDSECGKSNLLQVLIHGIKTGHTPEEARIILVDYRRSLLDSADAEHFLGYAASPAAATGLIKDIYGAMENRLPSSPELTPEQLRDRSWWSGPDLYLIVDDYDLVATPSGNALEPLVELLPQARDIGLHLILARSMAGVGRAMLDPMITRLREMASPALVMSGPKEEGDLFGLEPRRLPQGRGQLVHRSVGRRLVQTALFQPPPRPGDARVTSPRA